MCLFVDREQAWERWLGAIKNGAHMVKSEIRNCEVVNSRRMVIQVWLTGVKNKGNYISK